MTTSPLAPIAKKLLNHIRRRRDYGVLVSQDSGEDNNTTRQDPLLNPLRSTLFRNQQSHGIIQSSFIIFIPIPIPIPILKPKLCGVSMYVVSVIVIMALLRAATQLFPSQTIAKVKQMPVHLLPLISSSDLVDAAQSSLNR